MKKAYVYKMNLVPANLLGLVVFILLLVLTNVLNVNILPVFDKIPFIWILVLLMIYMILHEILHGIGYRITGTKTNKIKYGIELEKGILYTLVLEEVPKKNILVSLQMPFVIIGIITLLLGYILNIPLLVLLSIFNLMGASMDLVMFIYISRIKDVYYAETKASDEFILISKEDLTKRKSLFFKIIEVNNYKKEDYIVKSDKKITISKASIIFTIIYLIFGIIITLI
ncbi:MAG: DUF3267 domain-containing protein [Bacilli bacterium]|nr:DUF3267 domain-containing protein [Bacilli bacterium]